MLSQLAWTHDSPLFDALDAAGSVPPYKDVALPALVGVGRSIPSPLLHPRLRKLGARIPESPLSALHDRHASPSSTARRALFSPGGSVRKSPVPIAPKPPPQAKGGVLVHVLSPTRKGELSEASSPMQTSPRNQATPTKSSSLALGVSDPISLATTLLSPSKGPPLTPGSVRPLIPTSPPIPSVSVSQTTPRGQLGATPGGVSPRPTGGVSPRPNRTGSLALFYRKMYQLAFIRIKYLCERLELPSDLVQKLVIIIPTFVLLR